MTKKRSVLESQGCVIAMLGLTLALAGPIFDRGRFALGFSAVFGFVLAIAGGEKQKEAQEAGADVVGGEEMVDKIQGGFMDFDAVVATPDMMRAVGRLGKVLGPRGLTPNPKTGTVTFDIGKAVKEIKAGKVEFRVDKTGIVHAPVGKASFPTQNLLQNAQALVDAIVKAKPAAAKGKYLKSLVLSTTMGPAIKIDTAAVDIAKK